jgi:hypothetical protein
VIGGLSNKIERLPFFVPMMQKIEKLFLFVLAAKDGSKLFT